MKVQFYPTCRDNKTVDYQFNGEVITAKMGELEESYDLSVLQEGDELMTEGAETILSEYPIISASRTNGEVTVILKRFHEFTENPDSELVNPSVWEVTVDGELRKVENQNES